eukprot:m.26243 g.26243  ORF g.26243 m.26243 type:complete len:56 (+) comp7778_c0_seq2:2082-2249(+)
MMPGFNLQLEGHIAFNAHCKTHKCSFPNGFMNHFSPQVARLLRMLLPVAQWLSPS